MKLIEKQDYVVYDNGMMLNSKQPMQHIYVCLVSTKDYIFYIPKKTVGMFVVFNAAKIHQLFDGVTIEEGVKRLIGKAETVEELENSMINLLENDDKCIHKIADKKSFKFKSFLGKHTLRMSNGPLTWSSVMPVEKKDSKEFRLFHNLSL
ncbi:MAG: hypothetical protein COA97_03030 [Flavobacteriales bacterium]|nr:MAG: hypothetical protein COA97_03030 [Flavobacteriales bacterium]